MFAVGGLAYFASKGLRFFPDIFVQVAGLICLAGMAGIILTTPLSIQHFSQVLFLQNPRSFS